MYTVVFENVGRRKETWSAQCKESLTDEELYNFMYSQVKKHGVMSDDIEFLGGVIYAGFHAIGTFDILE